MNLIKINFFKRQAIYLLGLLIFSAFVWYVGPFINIGPLLLQLPSKRLYLISIGFLLWLLKMIIFDIQSPAGQSEKNIDETTPETLASNALQLEGRFAGAIQFLKKTFIDKQGKKISLAKLPWYLVIGATNSGKTSLLRHSGIHFTLAKQSKGTLQPTDDQCDWWATRDLVLVDVPGPYIVSTEAKIDKSPEKNSLVLWRKLLLLIKRYRFNPVVHGAIITLNLPELMRDSRAHKHHLLSSLKKAVLDLYTALNRTLPVYIAITKCDLLPGFNEFFSDLSNEELAQAWGIPLTPLEKNEKMADQFAHRFNQLIKRLNAQLITRLHQERNSQGRPAIKDFPLHLEQLKEAIVQFIKLYMPPEILIQGVYLTSSTQKNPDESAYLYPQQHALQLTLPPPLPQRSYFIKQLLLQHLVAPLFPAPIKQGPHKTWQRNFVYATAISVIVSATILLGRDFQLSVGRTRTIENQLAQYQANLFFTQKNQDNLLHLLPLLNALHEATNQPMHKLLLKFYANKSQQTAETLFQQALQEIVLPKMINRFETALQNSNNQNSDKTYTLLKAYLMLADANHFQIDSLTHALTQLLPVSAKTEEVTQLAHYMQNAVIARRFAIKLNVQLIAQIRKQLMRLPKTTLGLILLQDRISYSTNHFANLDIRQNDLAIFHSDTTLQIPAIYTKNLFKKIMTEEINMAANEAMQGNWAISNHPLLVDELAIDSLAAQLRTQYMTNYIEFWESALTHLTLTTPQTITQLANMVAALTGPHSPLLELLTTIKENTAFPPVITASLKLQNLNVLLSEANNQQDSLLYQIFISLKKLDAYLKTFTQSSDLSTAVLAATRKRMQNPSDGPFTEIHYIAEQGPEPIKTWLHSLANQTWRYMLFTSGTEIEKIWENTILLTYKGQIQNHYPFNPNAVNEVNLSQFINFFGQQGQLSAFYQTYLKPFVNEEDQWHWRVVDNGKLPFTETALQHLEHANHLQKAFFPNGDNKLYVPFALQPLKIDEKMRGFVLNINGQEIHYQKNLPNDRLIVWPGTHDQTGATLNFITPDNTLISKNIPGAWGWFKLVSHATQTIRSHRELVLNFEVNGHTAKYVLLAQGHFNPFLSANLEQSKLPDTLG